MLLTGDSLGSSLRFELPRLKVALHSTRCAFVSIVTSHLAPFHQEDLTRSSKAISDPR